MNVLKIHIHCTCMYAMHLYICKPGNEARRLMIAHRNILFGNITI